MTTMSNSEAAYTAQRLLERAARIEAVIETWKGVPDYCRTMQMEVWSLKVAASLIGVAREIIANNPKAASFTEQDKARAAIMVCEALSGGELDGVLYNR
jgi:hypothetical protein